MNSKTVFNNLLKITEYETKGQLPDPFLFSNGDRVKTSNDWLTRRDEIFQTAVELQFGTQPPIPEILEVEQLNLGKEHRSYKIHTGTRDRQLSFIIKVIMPRGQNRPMIIDGDMCAGYHMNEEFISAALEKDIGWVLFDRTELAHDIKSEGRKGALYDVYPEFTFGALGAWAWGYSRCIDALFKLNHCQIDCSCIALTGHSRGGKAAILAGAIDERATIVNPNEACLFGGGCYRIKMVGDYSGLKLWRSETLRDIWEETSFWVGPEMEQYIDNEEALPFDTHFLKALVAPRVLFVSEAAADVWANPVGSWMTTEAAKEVYKFLGVEEKLFWYFRSGTHYHKPEDIRKLVNIISHIHDGEKIEDGFFELPFTPPSLLYDWHSKN